MIFFLMPTSLFVLVTYFIHIVLLLLSSHNCSHMHQSLFVDLLKYICVFRVSYLYMWVRVSYIYMCRGIIYLYVTQDVGKALCDKIHILI